MKFFLNILLVISGVLLGCSNSHSINNEPPKANIDKTRQKAKDAPAFCKTKNFNTDFCILIDMSLHSGVKRFFIWDFQQDTITHRFLVGHGRG